MKRHFNFPQVRHFSDEELYRAADIVLRDDYIPNLFRDKLGCQPGGGGEPCGHQRHFDNLILENAGRHEVNGEYYFDPEASVTDIDLSWDFLKELQKGIFRRVDGADVMIAFQNCEKGLVGDSGCNKWVIIDRLNMVYEQNAHGQDESHPPREGDFELIEYARGEHWADPGEYPPPHVRYDEDHPRFGDNIYLEGAGRPEVNGEYYFDSHTHGHEVQPYPDDIGELAKGVWKRVDGQMHMMIAFQYDAKHHLEGGEHDNKWIVFVNGDMVYI